MDGNLQQYAILSNGSNGGHLLIVCSERENQWKFRLKIDTKGFTSHFESDIMAVVLLNHYTARIQKGKLN